jgi:hypothetical protein
MVMMKERKTKSKEALFSYAKPGSGLTTTSLLQLPNMEWRKAVTTWKVDNPANHWLTSKIIGLVSSSNAAYEITRMIILSPPLEAYHT